MPKLYARVSKAFVIGDEPIALGRSREHGAIERVITCRSHDECEERADDRREDREAPDSERKSQRWVTVFAEPTVMTSSITATAVDAYVSKRWPPSRRSRRRWHRSVGDHGRVRGSYSGMPLELPARSGQKSAAFVRCPTAKPREGNERAAERRARARSLIARCVWPSQASQYTVVARDATGETFPRRAGGDRARAGRRREPKDARPWARPPRADVRAPRRRHCR